MRNESRQLLVSEGDFNALSLESLAVRHRRETGQRLLPSNYTAIAVGGVTTADWSTIVEIDRNPVICFDNDSSGAGFGLVSRGQQHASLSAFTTPDIDSDLDSFIRSFGKDVVAAGEGLRDLFQNRQSYERSYGSVAAQIDEYRKDEDLEGFEKNRLIAETIIYDLHERAKLYHDGLEGYLFFTASKALLGIRIDDPDFRLLISRYGINPAEAIFKYVFEAITLEALDKGQKTEVYRFSYYDPGTNRLYIANNPNQVVRLSENDVEFVDNGTDGVLFLDKKDADPFVLVSVPNDRSPLEDFILSRFNIALGHLTRSDAMFLVMFWIYSLFFENLLITKPILTLLGPKGSGKTSSLSAIGTLLKGKKFSVTPLCADERDFDAAITNSYYVVLDNADTAPKWLDDRLATSATGGSIKKREYYTTNRLIEFLVKCYIAITARTPRFRRDDVADRLLILRVDRYEKFTSENILRQSVIENRDLIFSEVVQHLQEILTALRYNPPGTDVGRFRMADFADFSLRIARHYGVENRLKAILKKVAHEQSLFTLEYDTTFELIAVWVAQNSGREVTAAELCKELSQIAAKKGLDFPYTGRPRGLAQRLHNIASDLSEFVEIDSRDVGGRKRLYRFRTIESEE